MMGCSLRFRALPRVRVTVVGGWLNVFVLVVISMCAVSSPAACAGEGCWGRLVCTVVAGLGVAQAASSARTLQMLDLWWPLSSRTLGKKRLTGCLFSQMSKNALDTCEVVAGNHLPQTTLL